MGGIAFLLVAVRRYVSGSQLGSSVDSGSWERWAAGASIDELTASLENTTRALTQAQSQLSRSSEPAAAPKGNAAARAKLLDFALGPARFNDPSFPQLGAISFHMLRSVDTEVLFGPVSLLYKHQASSPTEVLTRQMLRTHVQPACARSSLGPLFIEVGAKEGFHGMLAARWGCRTIQVEPQPQCAIDLAFAVALAGERHTGKVINAFASDTEYSQQLKWSRSDGPKNFPGDARPKPAAMTAGHTVTVNATKPPKLVRSVRIDDLAKEDVLALKVDADGAEVRALRSAMGLVSKHQIKYLHIEFSPAAWRDFGVSAEQDAESVAAFFAAAPYSCRDISTARSEGAGTVVRADQKEHWLPLAWKHPHDIALWCVRQ